ncbi:MAG: ABC transporter substrate-binding protein [Chloroflexi bacterium]|nr:ABC transporter substrate-binding protein [Chloroflexota bacterium]
MRKVLILLVALVFALGTLLTACSSGQAPAPASAPKAEAPAQPQAETKAAPKAETKAAPTAEAKALEPYKIGGTFVMTGDQAEYTKKNLIAGMDFAIEEINAKGGINGHKLQGVYEDSKGDPKEGVAAMRKLVEVDKVPAVVTIYTFVTFAQIPVADETKTILYAASVQHPDLIKNSPWTFRNAPTAAQEGSYIAEWAAGKLNPKSVAVMYEENDAIRLQNNTFRDVFTKSGGKVLGEETFKPNDTDFRAQLSKLRSTNASNLVIHGSAPVEKARIMKQAREMGWNVQFIISSPLEDKQTIEIAGSAAEGAIYDAAYVDPAWIKRFKDKYGYEPDPNAAKNYDAVKVIAIGLEKGGTDTTKMAKAMTEIKEYNGALGKLVFDGSREAKIQMLMKTIKNGQFVELK